ncbi:MAG: DEAD/DEAH box helicase [Faecalibacterium prausnitzii]
MEETTIGAVLFDGIEENPYLNELYDAILYNYGRQLFGLTNLPEKEISVPAALRFADILSKSVHTQNEETHKLWAQEIVALLNALRPDDELIQYYLGSVLTSVSNFRGVSLKAADYVSADFLDRIFTQVSKEYLRIPEAENEYFFRAQKEIYEKFNEPYFSYSAPTSLGKSYIMRTFIREQIAKGKQCNFAIIVPTKALINETTEKLTEVLGPELKEKNYRIVTSAGAMALEEEHNFIFAMTPERLLYLLILMKDIPIEYLFIDEAHKISKKDGRSAFYYKVVDMLSQRSTPPHIIFASPNIPNPEVYLQLIPDVANRENYKIATKFSPVNQEKFLIDFKCFELHYYNEATQKLTKYCSFPEDKGLLDFVHELGEGARSIVYSNSKDNVVEYALQYATQLQPLHDSDLDVLAQDIRQDVHGDYYLADIVEKGVAYHMGYLPSTIRARIESLYKDGKIHTLFCTSTLLEGVNLPADNLFITSHKNGGDMSPVDFRNLMGRVGRIEFNLYGNVFLVCIKRKTKKERFLHLLQEKIVPQQLSLATALTPEQKTGIVSVLKSGQAEIPKDGSLPPAEYSLIRKVANILLKDIVSGRASRVKKEFSDVLSPEDEAAIVAAFAGREHSLDDDINLSLDQTERLAREIRSGRLHYPAIRIGGKADYNELRNFLERLCDIFKWETYEYDTLGFRNKSSGAHTKLSHYAFVLNQWVSGMSLNHMVTDSIDYYRSTGKGKVKLKGQYVAFKDEAPYVNALISGMLEDIEDVILFRIANYFLRFSQEYRACFPDASFTDWYELVEYGTTNPEAVWLQRNGFTREAAAYITEKRSQYITFDDNDQLRLKPALLECENRSIRREAEQVQYNSPEIYLES